MSIPVSRDVFPTLSPFNPFALTLEMKGSYIGESQYQKIKYGKEELEHEEYVDTSTLSEEGSGEAFIYAKKNLSDHYIIAILTSLAAITVSACTKSQDCIFHSLPHNEPRYDNPAAQLSEA